MSALITMNNVENDFIIISSLTDSILGVSQLVK